MTISSQSGLCQFQLKITKIKILTLIPKTIKIKITLTFFLINQKFNKTNLNKDIKQKEVKVPQLLINNHKIIYSKNKKIYIKIKKTKSMTKTNIKEFYSNIIKMTKISLKNNN